MKTINNILLAIIMLYAPVTYAQDIEGHVYEINENNEKEPLTGVNVYWAETMEGTVSDVNGHFHLHAENVPARLVISFIGYINDTLIIKGAEPELEIVLRAVKELEGIEITDRQKGNYIDRINPIKTTNITDNELTKAACCNLSESFETNASVDVSYNDAVSGAKQIHLLGLAGIYIQMMTENIPNLKGLASTYGLTFIPGPWMESIQISKGSASVINGYESITGQINVEYKKPDDSENLFLNLYANHIGKLEANLNSALKINDKWSTMVFAHYNRLDQKIDHNNDSFLDIPVSNQINLFNRWKFLDEHFMTQFGVKYVQEERTAGQLDFSEDKDQGTTNHYGINIDLERHEIFWKSGYVFPGLAGSSIGFINQFTRHQQDSYFGLNIYNGKQYSYHSNLIWQSILGNTNHKYSAGFSFNYDDYQESFNDSTFSRTEVVPGTFLQYTYSNENRATLLVGIRADFHSIYGTFYTPRLHLKYHIDEHTIIRASAGKGYRTASLFAENSYLLSSSRTFHILEDMQMEKAWNYGINVNRHFKLGKREISVNAEYYRTDFINQLVVDMDQNISSIYIYNLDGVSYSNSYQVEVRYDPFKKMEILAAYRYTDVKTTLNGELQRKPLVNRYKGLLTLSYYTNLKKWQFDVTAQFNGDQRLPDTKQNPVEYQRPDNSPEYIIINAQITKFFRKWNIYLGVENLTDFVQDDPIIAADQPFSKHFDASQAWGPIMGRKIYTGLKINI